MGPACFAQTPLPQGRRTRQSRVRLPELYKASASSPLRSCTSHSYRRCSGRVLSELVADKVSGDEGLRHRVLAKRLAKDRPMHRLVAEDAGDGLGEVAVAENRNHAKIAARCALLEAGREAQYVRLGLQRLDRELVVGGLFWLCRLTAERLHRLGEEIRMCLVLTLELHGEIEHRLLQKPTVRSQLIGCHRSELAAERRVEDVRVARRGIVLRLLAAVEACGTHECDGGRRKYSAARRCQ